MKTSLFDSLPIDIRKSSSGIEPVSAEWTADDKGMFRVTRSFPAGTPLALACSWLEQLRSFWCSAVIRLTDGRVIFFDAAGFSGMEAEGFSFGERFILFDSEQINEKENSDLFLSSNRLDRPFPGTRWLPSGSALLGPRLKMEDPLWENRLHALVALGICQYVRLAKAEDAANDRRHEALATALEKKTEAQGFSVKHITWKAGKRGGGTGFQGSLGEWLMAQATDVGFIYIEGEADLIEAAERSWLTASGRKDPYAQEDAALFQRQRQPGACILEGRTI